jgi:hypothetical protein
MDPREQKRLERLAKHVEDHKLATVEQLSDIEERIEAVEQTVGEKLSEVAAELKKKLGTDFEIDPEAIRGPQGAPGADGADADEEEIIERVIPVVLSQLPPVPTPQEVAAFVPNLKGDPGEPGRDGESIVGPAGRDGSPDTPEQIAAKVNTLDAAIEPKAIRGLEDLSRRVQRVSEMPPAPSYTHVEQLARRVATLEANPGGGGGTWGSITGTLSNQTDLQAALDAKADDLGADDNYVTDAEKVKLGNLSGTNTGDQTSIVGIAGTKSQFDTAVTDGNFLYAGDVTQYTDELAQDAVGAMVDTTLVYTDGTPLLSRAALTGAVTASAGSNATALGSFTITELNDAISDGLVPVNLTEFVSQQSWRVFYSDGVGEVQELALGADGTFLRSNGVEVAPSFATPSGSGDVSKVGTPANNQVGVWTGDGTIEGTSDLTYDGTSLNLITGKNLQIAGATVLADAAGTTTLSGIDALDATTEATVEAAIDTLPNLTSVQGRTVTLADAGADAIFGWDDSAGAYENLTAQEVLDALGVTASAAELNILDGATLTVAELNHVDGVTSAIQTQLDGKQPLDADLTTLAASFSSASASGAASLALHEDTDNGTNKVTLAAPAAIASDKTVTLPDATGTVALTSDIPTLSEGLNGDADAGKAAGYGANGELGASLRVRVGSSGAPNDFIDYTDASIELNSSANSKTTTVSFAVPSDNRSISFPDASGELYVPGGALGTPASGNLANCAGYPFLFVNFDGTAAANQAATYGRTGTTVTVSLTDHGYIAGNVVYCDFTSGGALDGVYVITSVTSGTFNLTTAASGTIAAGSTVSLLRRSIRASRGVHSVTYNNTVGRFYVNFSAAMADANYAVVGTCGNAGAANPQHVGYGSLATPTTAAFDVLTSNATPALANLDFVSLMVVS